MTNTCGYSKAPKGIDDRNDTGGCSIDPNYLGLVQVLVMGWTTTPCKQRNSSALVVGSMLLSILYMEDIN
jgi:hypothetical protein